MGPLLDTSILDPWPPDPDLSKSRSLLKPMSINLTLEALIVEPWLADLGSRRLASLRNHIGSA